MQKVLFITTNVVLADAKVGTVLSDNPENIRLQPYVVTSLNSIANELDYKVVMLIEPEEPVCFQQYIFNFFKNEGINIDFENQESYVENHILKYVLLYGCKTWDVCLISHNESEVLRGFEMGIKSIYFGIEPLKNADLSTMCWKDICRFLRGGSRKSRIIRNTNETNISVELNLNGCVNKVVSTGVGFFDHMLEQIAVHGNIDLTINVQGDTYVDSHHTVEDVGIALGLAFSEALGSRKGIERYGFVLPMDDCLAQVAIDFGGRPWLVWNAEFKREKIGDMPSEMFMHFFKSFSDNAKCNLNIKAEGENEHHKIEGIFKAFAKALKMAVQTTNKNSIPSSKGVI